MAANTADELDVNPSVFKLLDPEYRDPQVTFKKCLVATSVNGVNVDMA